MSIVLNGLRGWMSSVFEYSAVSPLDERACSAVGLGICPQYVTYAVGSMVANWLGVRGLVSCWNFALQRIAFFVLGLLGVRWLVFRSSNMAVV